MVRDLGNKSAAATAAGSETKQPYWDATESPNCDCGPHITCNGSWKNKLQITKTDSFLGGPLMTLVFLVKSVFH